MHILDAERQQAADARIEAARLRVENGVLRKVAGRARALADALHDYAHGTAEDLGVVDDLNMALLADLRVLETHDTPPAKTNGTGG